tara:strand:+ start:232 stop:576 length:345 start_codon:yes stop_codon:yes gene_type:complete
MFNKVLFLFSHNYLSVNKKEFKMKKYSIGLVTGIVFSISAFMFMGAAREGINDSAITSNGLQYSFIIGSDGGSFSILDHKNGKAYVTDVGQKIVMEMGKDYLRGKNVLVTNETK